MGLSSGGRTPVFVIGIDGATWNIIDTLVDSGYLPNISELIRGGYRARLESIKPPLSIPAWKCYSSGLTPSQLGIHGFLYYDKSAGRIKPVTAKDLYRVRDFWEYISLLGRVLVFRHFMSYPVKRINGFMISDYPVDSKGYNPPSLREEILRRFGDPFFNINFVKDKYSTYNKVMEYINKDFNILRYIIDSNDIVFAHYTILHSDGVQHFFWDEWEENLRNDNLANDYITRLWRTIDKNIGFFIDFLSSKYGDNFNLVIVSDHGFRRLKSYINMSHIMYESGLVRLTMKGVLARLAGKLIPSSMVSYEKFLKIVEYIINIMNRFKRGSAKWGLQHKITSSYYEKFLDFNSSPLIPVSGDIYYVNKDHIAINVEEVKEKITNVLERHGIKDTVIDEIIYEIDEQGNHLIKIYSKDFQPSFNILNKAITSRPTRGKWTGKHDLYGIFLAYGKDIRSGASKEPMKIIDVAPTILAMYNLPIPNTMKGSIASRILKNKDKVNIRYTDPSYYEKIFIKTRVKMKLKKR